MPKSEETGTPNWEAECLSLRDQIRELKAQIQMLTDEKQKLNIRHEELLSELEKRTGKIRFLEGQIEAYRYCMNCRR